MHEATLRLAAADPASADAVRRSLLVELADGPGGVRTTLSVDGSALVAQVRADDLSGLRAAVTGLVRLGNAALASLAGQGP